MYRRGNDIAEDFLLAMEINDNITQTWFVGEVCEFYSFKVRAYSLEGYGKLSDAVNVVTACEGKYTIFVFSLKDWNYNPTRKKSYYSQNQELIT